MRKMGLRSVAHPDKAHALIELLADDERLGSISLDVAALEKLITKLAKIRGSLSHRVPPRLSPDAQLEVTHRAPVFYAQATVEGEPGALLPPPWVWMACLHYFRRSREEHRGLAHVGCGNDEGPGSDALTGPTLNQKRKARP